MTSTRIGQIAIPAAIVGIVVVMVVPLPAAAASTCCWSANLEPGRGWRW
ncbi:MAG: hypothetical protein KatS3mg010_1473 [Acidimicrobiia bacterium]|nr:MAG: hypothetical protein KatS3mg010_1473 [Acidimicrobiia bacterium]